MPAIAKPFGLLYVLILGASVAYGIYYTLDWPIYSDGAVMQYMAWRMLHGAAPYRDLYEFNFPGIYLLHMLEITLFGGSDFAFRLFDLFFCALSAWGFLLLGWSSSKIYAWVGALFFVAYHLSWGAQNMAERDFLMVPFLLFATYFLREFLDHPDNPALMFLFGLLTGFALWIKPIIAVFIVLSGLAALSRAHGSSQKIKLVFSTGAGVLIPALLINLWLYQMDALAAFYDIQWHFTIAIYSHFHQLSQRITLRFTLIILYSTVFMVFLAYKKSSMTQTERTVVLIGLVYGLLHFYMQRKGSWYHLYPLGAFMALFVMLAIPKLRCSIWEKTILLLLLLVICINFSPLQNMEKEKLDAYKEDFPLGTIEKMKLATDAALRTVPAPIRKKWPDSIHFLGFPSGQLWTAAYHYHWVESSRHIYPFPIYGIFNSTYMDEQAVELMHDLSTMKPLVIIVSSESWPFKDNLVYDAIDSHQPWKSFFAKNYHLTKKTAAYRVYARVK